MSEQRCSVCAIDQLLSIEGGKITYYTYLNCQKKTARFSQLRLIVIGTNKHYA